MRISFLIPIRYNIFITKCKAHSSKSVELLLWMIISAYMLFVALKMVAFFIKQNIRLSQGIKFCVGFVQQ